MAVKNIGSMDLERGWAYGDNTWKPGMDRNLQKLSVMTMPSVKSRVVPIDFDGEPGDVYIDPATSFIVFWDRDSDDEEEDFTWLGITPQEPSLVWVEDEQVYVTWSDDTTQWSVMFDPSVAIPAPATRAIGMFFPGELKPSARVWATAVGVSFRLEADMAGSRGFAFNPPQGQSATFWLLKNDVNVGSIVFAAGAQNPTFVSGVIDVVEGDILSLASPPNLYDMNNIAITLKGVTPGL